MPAEVQINSRLSQPVLRVISLASKQYAEVFLDLDSLHNNRSSTLAASFPLFTCWGIKFLRGSAEANFSLVLFIQRLDEWHVCSCTGPAGGTCSGEVNSQRTVKEPVPCLAVTQQVSSETK